MSDEPTSASKASLAHVFADVLGKGLDPSPGLRLFPPHPAAAAHSEAPTHPAIRHRTRAEHDALKAVLPSATRYRVTSVHYDVTFTHDEIAAFLAQQQLTRIVRMTIRALAGRSRVQDKVERVNAAILDGGL